MTSIAWTNEALGSAARALRGAARERPATAREHVVSRAEDLAKADESTLIDGCQAGDEDAFRVLVERYRKRAYWLAYQLVHNEQDATDIAQEAFVRVFKSIHRFDRRYRFYTWLYKIVHNLAVDHLRKRGDRRRISIDALGDVRAKTQPVSRRIEHEELGDRVMQVLDRLPPKYKTVMMLRELEGIDAKEVASIVGSTHATVRWRLHRARALFREEWEKLYGAAPGKDGRS